MGLITPAAAGTIFDAWATDFNKQYTALQGKGVYEKIAMTIPSGGSSTIYNWSDTYPGFRKWIGQRTHHDGKILQQTVVNEKWEDSIDLPRTSEEDDAYGVLSPRVLQLANAAYYHAEIMVLNLAINGHTSGYNSYDATTFFGSHTWKGSTFNNDIGGLALDATNFETAVTTLYNIVGAKGSQDEAPLSLNPEFVLLVGPKQRAEAWRVTKAEYNQFGASNMNYQLAEPVVSPMITDNSWYLLDKSNPMKPFIYQTRVAVELQTITDPNDYYVREFDAFQFLGRIRDTATYGLWQLAVGSKVAS